MAYDHTPRPRSEWHEDIGDVLWWKFPVTEAPYVGSPLDIGFPVELHAEVRTHQKQRGRTIKLNVGGWPGYHTHFTLIPMALPPGKISNPRGKTT